MVLHSVVLFFVRKNQTNGHSQRLLKKKFCCCCCCCLFLTFRRRKDKARDDIKIFFFFSLLLIEMMIAVFISSSSLSLFLSLSLFVKIITECARLSCFVLLLSLFKGRQKSHSAFFSFFFSSRVFLSHHLWPQKEERERERERERVIRASLHFYITSKHSPYTHFHKYINT